jgi:hypothetical protein
MYRSIDHKRQGIEYSHKQKLYYIGKHEKFKQPPQANIDAQVKPEQREKIPSPNRLRSAKLQDKHRRNEYSYRDCWDQPAHSCENEDSKAKNEPYNGQEIILSHFSVSILIC